MPQNSYLIIAINEKSYRRPVYDETGSNSTSKKLNL